MAEQFKNQPAGGHQSTLVNAILANAVSLEVASAAKFSTLGTFRILVGDDENDPDAELFIVTAVAGAVFTVTPAAEGTIAIDHPAGSKVYQVLTVAGLLAATVGASSDTELLFNNAGVVDGSAELTWNTVATPSGGTGLFLGDPNNDAGWGFGSRLNLTAVSETVVGFQSVFANTVNLTGDGAAGFPYFFATNVGGAHVVSGELFNVLNGLYLSGGVTVTPHGAGAYSEVKAYSATSPLLAAQWAKSSTESGDPSAIDVLVNFYAEQAIDTGGVVGLLSAYYAPAPTVAGTLTTVAQFYAADLAGAATNPYYGWFDSRGVLRWKEDSAVDGGNAQAIMALYNPRFTKYTAGATDHERVVQQWVSDVLQYGTEKGGSGTLRKMQLIGAGLILGTDILPTSAAGLATGQLWNDSGTLKVA